LLPVSEMTTETFKVFELVRQPIMVCFADFEHSNKAVAKASINLVEKVLPKVAEAFFMGIIVSYADNKVWFRHRKMLGITHDAVPAISINSNEQKVNPFPEDQEPSEGAIRSWLDKYFQGELKPKESEFGEIVDYEIKKGLYATLQLTRQLFVEKVYTEGKDMILLIYSSGFENQV